MMLRFKILFIIIFLISCNKKQFVLLVGNPNSEYLNDKLISIYVDGYKIYDSKLKSTNITPSYNELILNTSYGVHNLLVKIDEISFEYDLKYPDDKLVIISPTYINGKVNIGILKKDNIIDLY